MIIQWHDINNGHAHHCCASSNMSMTQLQLAVQQCRWWSSGTTRGHDDDDDDGYNDSYSNDDNNQPAA